MHKLYYSFYQIKNCFIRYKVRALNWYKLSPKWPPLNRLIFKSTPPTKSQPITLTKLAHPSTYHPTTYTSVVRPSCLVRSKHIKDATWKRALYFTSLIFYKHQCFEIKEENTYISHNIVITLSVTCKLDLPKLFQYSLWEYLLPYFYPTQITLVFI